LCYIASTSHLGFPIQPSLDSRIHDFCDSNWGVDLDDRKSTLGFCVYFGSNLVSWTTRKQKVVSRSTTEVEYRSIDAVTA